MTLSDTTAIVGTDATPFCRRGPSQPQTVLEMAAKAILAALSDAGLTVRHLDGFAYYSGGFDTALLAQTIGVPEVRFTTTLTGGGGGSAGSVGPAAAAVSSGQARWWPVRCRSSKRHAASARESKYTGTTCTKAPPFPGSG